MARTSNFANVATVTRASTKTDAGGWDFTSGGTVGTLTEYASGVAAIHPTAGLLVEESTTNEIRNPRFEGATVGTLGSGGALPTNFAYGPGGMTWTVDEIGTESGMDYMQISLSGTATGDAVMYFEGSSQIPALTGEDWTFGLGMKVTAGTFPGNLLFWIRGLTSGGSDSDDIGTQDPDPTSLLDGNIRRFWASKTLNNNLGTTAYVRPAIYIDNPSGAVSCTFRLYAPQCENKAYPTSPAFPTAASPAASTRAADVISIANGAWVADSADGSLYIEGVPNQLTKDGAFAELQAGSSSERVFVGHVSGNARAFVVAGGTTSASGVGNAAAIGTASKIAIGFAANDFAISSTGAAQTTDTSGNIPSGTYTLYVGSRAGGGSPLTGYIKDLRYWPKRLTNAELEALVGN